MNLAFHVLVSESLAYTCHVQSLGYNCEDKNANFRPMHTGMNVGVLTKLCLVLLKPKDALVVPGNYASIPSQP